MNASEEMRDFLTTELSLDTEARHAIRNDPRQYAIDKGIITEDSDIEIKLVIGEPGTLHIPLVRTDDIGYGMGVDDLQRIQGGGNTTGSLGCATTASTLSTASSCVGCVSSASTVGTAGTG